jgi:hypothetical protein
MGAERAPMPQGEEVEKAGKISPSANFGCGESGRHVRHQRRGAIVIFSSGGHSMNSGMKTLAPIVLAIVGVASLILAWAGPVSDGVPPPNYTSITFAIIFLSLAVILFARGRRSGGETVPPSA